ncbi:MAG: hypothetical protein R6T89_00290 [Candidatus Syntrophosphaera sp.]
MRHIRYLALLFLVSSILLLASCAVLDTATLDTAMPIGPKKFHGSIYGSTGLDLKTLTYNDPDDPIDDHIEPDIFPMVGLHLSYGLDEKNEIGGKLWAATPYVSSGGEKLYLKHLLSHQGKNYLSVLPGFTHVSGNAIDYNGKPERIMSFGPELQLLYTCRAADWAAFTLGARGNYNFYYERVEYVNGQVSIIGPEMLTNYGVRANIELHLGEWRIVPEIGIDIVPTDRYEFDFLPNAGLAIGFRK